MRRFDTILIDPTATTTDNTSHPLFYCKVRTNILQNISEKINVAGRVGNIDTERNVHVDYLTRVYQKKKRELDRLQNQRNRHLDPNKFKSILGDFGESKEEIEERECRRKERQRQRLYEDYIMNCEYHIPKQPESAEIQIIYGESGHHLSEQDAKIVHRKQQDLKLINREIGRLRMQLETDKKKLIGRGECNNVPLLQKMSNSIISAYMLHFDQIFNLLIDEILTEEVEHLNRMEGGLESSQPLQHTQGQKKLLNLLHQLDELCYEE